MSDLKRLKNQLEQLERSYKLGIISEDEYTRGKENLEKKIEPLEKAKKNSEESKKIIDEALSDTNTEKDNKKEEKKTKKKESQKEKTKPQTTQKEKTNKSKTKEETKKKKTDNADKQKSSANNNKKINKAPEEKRPKWGAGILIILLVIVLFFMFKTPQPDDTTSTIGEKNLTNINKTLNIFYYSSYSCEYCQKTNEILERIDMIYGDNVNTIRNHYPYNIKIDFKMDIAAECAANQGVYDDYSKLLYAAEKPVSREELVEYANNLAINTTQFENCLTENKTAKVVLEDYKTAVRIGIQKIPAVNIGGATISGVKNPALYAAIIDDELQSE
ncbi:MAG: DsbA family protein [Nanobdellota archaeon]